MNFLYQGFRKLEHYRQTDGQTDRRKRTTTPHSRVATTVKSGLQWSLDSH